MPKGITIDENNVFDEQNLAYRSILYSLIEFNDKGGLTRDQLRYILVKGFERKNAPSRIREFFDKVDVRDRLPSLYYNLHVYPECIKTSGDLDDKLFRLHNELEIIKLDKRGKRGKYRIDKNFLSKEYRRQNQDFLNSFKQNRIICISNKQIPGTNLILYGISDDLYKSNQKEIDVHVEKIQEQLNEIKKIKIDKLADNLTDVFYTIRDGYQNENLKKYVIDNGWNLYRFFCMKKIEAGTEEFDPWENTPGITLEEKRDLLKKLGKVIMNLNLEFLPLDVSFSSCPKEFGLRKSVIEMYQEFDKLKKR